MIESLTEESEEDGEVEDVARLESECVTRRRPMKDAQTAAILAREKLSTPKSLPNPRVKKPVFSREYLESQHQPGLFEVGEA